MCARHAHNATSRIPRVEQPVHTTFQWLSSGEPTGGVASRQEERYAMDQEVSGPANSRKMRWPFRVYSILIFLFPFSRVRPTPMRSRAQSKSKVARDREKKKKKKNQADLFDFADGLLSPRIMPRYGDPFFIILAKSRDHKFKRSSFCSDVSSEE